MPKTLDQRIEELERLSNTLLNYMYDCPDPEDKVYIARELAAVNDELTILENRKNEEKLMMNGGYIA